MSSSWLSTKGLAPKCLLFSYFCKCQDHCCLLTSSITMSFMLSLSSVASLLVCSMSSTLVFSAPLLKHNFNDSKLLIS